MKKKLNFRRKRCDSFIALLFTIALCCNNLQASEKTPGMSYGEVFTTSTHAVGQVATITYHSGMVGNIEQTKTVAKGTKIKLTNNDINESRYVLLGWSTMMMPYISNYKLESLVTGMPQYHALGDTINITDDLTLYAVWAHDFDGDGYADYNANLIKPTVSSLGLEIEFTDDDSGVSLRKMPAWDNNYDMMALRDTVYYVGCTNLPEFENHIYLNPAYCFAARNITPRVPMDFIIEYDGVLTDGCMIGGKEQKALDTIKITQTMINNGFTIDSLINVYPFKFNSIKKDGQGILRMYFKLAGTDSFPAIADFSTTLKWTKPFKDPENGDSDVLTIKFNIYNKPEFRSEMISQSLDTLGNLRLNHEKGTPIDYMMRCFNEFRWRPAGFPLTSAEKLEIGDSVSICLREMDRAIAYPQLEIIDFLSPEFGTSANPNYTIYRNKLYQYRLQHLLDSIWYNYFDDPSESQYINYMTIYNGLITGGARHIDVITFLIPTYEMALIGNPGPHYIRVESAANVEADAMMPAYGRYLAEQVYIPDPCRGIYKFSFETRVDPVIMREVYIPQVSGLTIDRGYGTHYVQSQRDFRFSVRYETDQPLSVKTNRIIEGKEEQLIGTLNAVGEYEYIIRRVTDNIVLTFGPDYVDNTSVDEGITVWSHNNTIRIHSDRDDTVSIYSIAGQMIKQFELSAGETSVPVERGIYVVKMKGGATNKVVVK